MGAAARRVGLGLIERGVLPAAGLTMNAAILPMTAADLEVFFEALDRVADASQNGPRSRPAGLGLGGR